MGAARPLRERRRPGPHRPAPHRTAPRRPAPPGTQPQPRPQSVRCDVVCGPPWRLIARGPERRRPLGSPGRGPGGCVRVCVCVLVPSLPGCVCVSGVLTPLLTVCVYVVAQGPGGCVCVLFSSLPGVCVCVCLLCLLPSLRCVCSYSPLCQAVCVCVTRPVSVFLLPSLPFVSHSFGALSSDPWLLVEGSGRGAPLHDVRGAGPSLQALRAREILIQALFCWWLDCVCSG